MNIEEVTDEVHRRIGINAQRVREAAGKTKNAIGCKVWPNAKSGQWGKIDEIERGIKRITVRTLVMLAKALDTTVERLVANPEEAWSS